MIELASRSIPENTKKKAMWAYRMFEAWRNWRRRSDVHKMPVVDLNEVLSQFIAEVRKDGGERYPGKTLCEIISSFQKYLEINLLIEWDRLF